LCVEGEEERAVRVWDEFLTERDRVHLATLPPPPKIGFGETPALLLIDHAQAALGEERLPLLESIKKYPLSMGLEAWEGVDRTRDLLDLFRERNGVVVHTTMLAGPNTPHEFYSVLRLSPPTRTRGGASRINPSGTDDYWDLVPALAPREEEIVIRKLSPSAFHGTPLSGVLRRFGVDTLLMTGNSTSGCVRASVIDAASENFRAIVVEECVYDRTQASHALNLFDMDQKYADVLPFDEVADWIRARDVFTYENERVPLEA
jgi:nicotinamidase-related amidase